jgi:hypothetical protein
MPDWSAKITAKSSVKRRFSGPFSARIGMAKFHIAAGIGWCDDAGL